MSTHLRTPPPVLLLATDLDRTLISNGVHPESPQARDRFRRLAARPEVRLVYVTGRHLALVEEALRHYQLPAADLIICDVGTSIYLPQGRDWEPWRTWTEALRRCWPEGRRDALAAAMADIPTLRLQAPEQQGPFKLSYETSAIEDPRPLLAQIQTRLAACGSGSRVVWSIDETTATGLVDILPECAGKLHALEFVRQRLDIPKEATVFAGDSGNDLEILESAIPSVLVANAHEDVRREAVARAARLGTSDALYLARGGPWGMNGNYSAGILEGVLHFHPSVALWLEEPA